MSVQSSPEGPHSAKEVQLLFAAGESPTVEAGMQARRAALLKLNESYDGLGDAMATDPTEIPVDFLPAAGCPAAAGCPDGGACRRP